MTALDLSGKASAGIFDCAFGNGIGGGPSGMGRRRFLMLGAAGFAGAAFAAEGASGAPAFDDALTALISDIHVTGREYEDRPAKYANDLFLKMVDEILALRPRPRRVVAFGDVAQFFGREGDYAEAAKGFGRLAAAGIETVITTGNHDHREAMFARFPEIAKRSPVPGRAVAVVDLGHADLLLLDSLQESDKGPGSLNPGGGTLDDAQWDWLESEAKRRTRPFFVGSHHSVNELRRGGRTLLSALSPLPLFKGYIHGHEHFWQKGHRVRGWDGVGTSRRFLRVLCLPSTGYWGDIGFALMRTAKDRAVVSLEMRDFIVYGHTNTTPLRPPEHDMMLEERSGETCTFLF